MAVQQEAEENEQPNEVQQEQEEYVATEEHQPTENIQETESDEKLEPKTNNNGTRGGFLHGLAVGLGIGCIATFVILWITIFFTPLVPHAATYEALLSVFIYPLIYLLAVGLVALTAGIVREYYSRI